MAKAQLKVAQTENGGKVEPKVKKTACPITRKEFRENAQPVMVTLAGSPVVADVKEFSTGSLGWYVNGKTVIQVAGKAVTVQVGLNMTIVNSKELPQ